MARLPTTADVFNAIAEPQRRAILTLLRQGEQSVGEIAEALNLKQPQTSKHLRVLSKVNVVSVRKQGKQRLYSLHSEALQPIYDWVIPFEQLWHERYDRLDDYLETLQKKENTSEQNESKN
jgi:DNA-binding transcriptional ArsR family regulator